MSRHLEHSLTQLLGEELLQDEAITEIAINPDLSVWTERSGDAAMQRVLLDLSVGTAEALARDLAGHHPISAQNPLAGSQFTMGGALWRAQVVLPPAVEQGVSITLRRAVARDFSLDELLQGCDDLKASMNDLKCGFDPDEINVFEAFDQGNIKDFLCAAVRAKWNILLSGGTSSGKTTWLRAALAEVEQSERILTIEDVREIRPAQPNHVSLVASETVSSRDLLKACLRLRPERIVMGELRGAEAYDFLSAINSGHPGGISTLHASNPDAALSRLALMVMQADTGLTYSEIIEYCRSMIDVIIQFKKTGGKRRPTALRVLRPRPENLPAQKTVR